jgi:hypothetical protein
MRASRGRRGSIDRMACPNRECELHGRIGKGNVVRHGFSQVKWGRRRRYRCTACGKTCGATTGTPYKRLQHSMRAFDRVAALSVEGVSKAAIARTTVAPGTPFEGLERAGLLARRFNKAKTSGYVLRELQLEELKAVL